MMKILTTTTLATGLVLGLTATSIAQQDQNTQQNKAAQGNQDRVVLTDIVTTTHNEFGDYITDGKGSSLYMFMADTQGTGDKAASSACQDACAEAWPPVTIKGAPQVGPDVEPDMVGQIERADGTMQVTYNGWPLYYFVQDKQPGDTAGQDKEGFGGEWYLLNPNGEPIHD